MGSRELFGDGNTRPGTKRAKGDSVFMGGDDAMYRHAGSICRRNVLVLLCKGSVVILVLLDEKLLAFGTHLTLSQWFLNESIKMRDFLLNLWAKGRLWTPRVVLAGQRYI